MGPLRRVAAYLDEVSEPWIGWRVPPVQRAFADAQWEADGPDAYCRRCGETVGPGEAGTSGCAACRNGPGIGDGVLRLGRYESTLREWVLGIKYGQWAAMGEALGRRLGDAVRQGDAVDLHMTAVVPMAMPWQRRLYRGIDHARVIAAGVARALDAPVVPCLTKSNGPPQVSLTATERAAVGGRGMRLRRRWGGWPLDGMDVAVVDDVRTTGASLRGAIRLIRSLGARRVIACVVAVAEEPRRRSRPVEKRPEPVEHHGPTEL